jgi:GNAT superfamily N-acetyltransferase
VVIGRLHCLVVDCAEPRALAGFYAELLGLELLGSGPDWAAIGARSGVPAMLFNRVVPYQAPTWPAGTVPAQMHADVLVDDLDEAEPRVLALGATLLDGSDKPIGFRVYADPAGHPFCLVTPESIPWQQPALAVRVAEAGDLDALRGVFRRASLANAGDRAVLLAHPEVLVWSGDAIAGGRVRVAVEDGTIVGFATTVPVDGGLELDDLFVEPDRMRRGVGRRLVEDVLDAAGADGVEHVWVTANPHAMAFYTAVGFVPDGTAPTRFGPAPRLRLDVPSR